MNDLAIELVVVVVVVVVMVMVMRQQLFPVMLAMKRMVIAKKTAIHF